MSDQVVGDHVRESVKAAELPEKWSERQSRGWEGPRLVGSLLVLVGAEEADRDKGS